jgi:hypothetical protein
MRRHGNRKLRYENEFLKTSEQRAATFVRNYPFKWNDNEYYL